ncbi:MAG TPA: VWA domain-containing protein [Planctomycetota bacterium]|nr:VWA domain-containing protein [Planctomycetota bacterium]
MGKNHQLPSSKVAQEFGEVNVCKVGNEYEILFTILMEPSGKDAEGWKTGVALDSSVSLQWAYGKKLEGKVPPEVMKSYRAKGWVDSEIIDGLPVSYMKKEANHDAIEKGYLHYSENIMQKLAHDFVSYLADNLDSQGKTLVAYWACGTGKEFEILGELSSEEFKNIRLTGPKKHGFGKKTCLLPVLKAFQEELGKAKRSMAIFLTDGNLEDFEEVKEYTIQMAQKIAAGQKNFMKCVLIGVGDQISEEQMEILDDLETGTDIDIWDHKIAKEMRSLLEIFAEVVDENQIIAPTATILDDKGKIVKQFSDGLPAKVTFTMPATSKHFVLQIGQQKIIQNIEYPEA